MVVAGHTDDAQQDLFSASTRYDDLLLSYLKYNIKLMVKMK